MLKLKAFRAADRLDLCQRFADGHTRVLLDYGVTKVTSSSTDWFYNPSVYVIIAEHTASGEVVGGVRVHLADGVTPLPIEDAVSIVDDGIFSLVQKHIPGRTAELCGLWNSKSIAGRGLGSYFLMRAGISLTKPLYLSTLFALCAPHTLRISVEKGFEIEKSIGDEGRFVYPKLDLIATSIIIRDTENLSKALPEERRLIHELREYPVITRQEESPKGNIEIVYDLKL